MPTLTGSGGFSYIHKGSLENTTIGATGVADFSASGRFESANSFVDIRARTVGGSGETFNLYDGSNFPRNQCVDIPMFSLVYLFVVKALTGTLQVGPTTGGTNTWTGGEAPFDARQSLAAGDFIIAYDPAGYAVTENYNLLKFTGDGITPTTYDLIIIGSK